MLEFTRDDSLELNSLFYKERLKRPNYFKGLCNYILLQLQYLILTLTIKYLSDLSIYIQYFLGTSRIRKFQFKSN